MKRRGAGRAISAGLAGFAAHEFARRSLTSSASAALL